MQLQVQAKNMNGGNIHLSLNTVPNVCPICHHNILPANILYYAITNRKMAQSVHRCSREECQEMFVATYKITGAVNNNRHECRLSKIAPLAPQPSEFSESILEVSPNFVKIYDQALAAESHNLDQLVGIGLRKALEFLIKDFAIQQNPDSESAIKRSMPT